MNRSVQKALFVGLVAFLASYLGTFIFSFWSSQAFSLLQIEYIASIGIAMLAGVLTAASHFWPALDMPVPSILLSRRKSLFPPGTFTVPRKQRPRKLPLMRRVLLVCLYVMILMVAFLAFRFMQSESVQLYWKCMMVSDHTCECTASESDSATYWDVVSESDAETHIVCHPSLFVDEKGPIQCKKCFAMLEITVVPIFILLNIFLLLLCSATVMLFVIRPLMHRPKKIH